MAQQNSRQDQNNRADQGRSEQSRQGGGSGGGKPSYNPANYETVNDRIKRFYAEHADGRIACDLISDTRELGTVICKASVYLSAADQAGALPRGTGIASETFGDGNFVNRGSHIENCETSAIGRALANAGYSGKAERASREEMEKAERWKTGGGAAYGNAAPRPLEARTAVPAPGAGDQPTARQQRAEDARAARERGEQYTPPAINPAPEDDPAGEPTVPANARLSCNQCGKELKQAQYTVSLTNFGIPLCPVHQEDAKRGAASGE